MKADSNPKVPAQSTRYFASWSGYSLPMQPVDEISESEALDLRSYYIGIYEGNLLVSFEKVLDGRTFFTDVYTYWEGTSTLKHRLMTKEDGSITEQEFDRKGDLLLDQ